MNKTKRTAEILQFPVGDKIKARIKTEASHAKVQRVLDSMNRIAEKMGLMGYEVK